MGTGAWAVGLSDGTAAWNAAASAFEHIGGEHAPQEMLDMMTTLASVAGTGSIAITPTGTGIQIESEGLVTAATGTFAAGTIIPLLMWRMEMARWEAERAAVEAAPAVPQTTP